MKAFLDNGVEPVVDGHGERLANGHGQISEKERSHSFGQDIKLQMSVVG